MIRACLRQTLKSGVLLVYYMSPNALGDIVNDPPYNASSAILYYHPVGQTFTAVDSTIHTISVGILDYNRQFFPEDHDLSLVLWEGAVLYGQRIATVTVTDIPDRFADWLDFVFEPPLSVVVGEAYTLEIIDDTPRWGLEHDGGNDTYSGGHAWFEGEIALDHDLRFRVLADFRPGACCMPDKCLQDIDAVSCRDSWGGIHAGTGSYCDAGECDRGACCDPLWGECTEVLPQECQTLDWRFIERNVTCAEAECASYAYGACCYGEACSTDNYMTRETCEGTDGVWAGPNTYCDVNTCPPCRFGDLDYDADFDLRDFAVLQGCFGQRSALQCICADLDRSTYIDEIDIAEFLGHFAGPN